MKKLFFPFIIALLIILNGCQDYTGFYYIYLVSTDSLQSIKVTYNADNGKTEYTKTVALPCNEPISINTPNFKIKATICRMNNTGVIRGLISSGEAVNVNGEYVNPYSALLVDSAAIMTPDSMLNYLKQTNNYGYFELQPNESCKSITSR